MRTYNVILLFFIGILQLSRCETKSYDLDIPAQEANETDAEDKIASPHFLEKPSDDKNLSKRRSYYDDRDDKNPDFEYSQKSRYDFKANSEFTPTHHKIPYHGDRERHYESNKENFDWNSDKRMSYSGMDDRRSYGGSISDMEDRRSSQTYFPRSKLGEKLEWERPADFYNPARGYRVYNDRDMRYESNISHDPDMSRDFRENKNNLEDKRTSHAHSTLKDYERSNEFIADKEVVSRLHPRFPVPSSMNYAITNDFPLLEESELCKPEKAIIINLKNECPLSKHSRNRIIHKYLFPHKTQLSTSSQLHPNDQYYSSDSNAAFYYI